MVSGIQPTQPFNANLRVADCCFMQNRDWCIVWYIYHKSKSNWSIKHKNQIKILVITMLLVHMKRGQLDGHLEDWHSTRKYKFSDKSWEPLTFIWRIKSCLSPSFTLEGGNYHLKDVHKVFRKTVQMRWLSSDLLSKEIPLRWAHSHKAQGSGSKII